MDAYTILEAVEQGEVSPELGFYVFFDEYGQQGRIEPSERSTIYTLARALKRSMNEQPMQRSDAYSGVLNELLNAEDFQQFAARAEHLSVLIRKETEPFA